MPLLLKHTDPLLGVWKMDETEEELLAMLGSAAADCAAALRAMKAERRRKEWLSSRVLLRTLTGVEPQVAYHPDGAPYLRNLPLAVSISHTDGYAAVLLKPNGAAGVDIERRHPRVLKVRSRFLSSEEDAMISERDAADHALIYWCAKEAVYKMMRAGEVDFARHIFVEPFDIAAAGGEIRVREMRTAEGRTYSLRYEVTPEFVLVYCV